MLKKLKVKNSNSGVSGLPPTRLELDAIDWHILALLQADARVSNVDLARAVHLSPSPCLARVRRLEEAGLISRYATLLNPQALRRVIIHALAPVVVDVHLIRETELAEVVKARDAMRLRFRPGQCRQQHGREDGDDGNHHEQFNQCECRPAMTVGGKEFLVRVHAGSLSSQ